MIQHILFPSDGSQSSRHALAYLIHFASKFNAEITLLHTYEFTMGHVMSRYATDSSSVSELEQHIAQYGENMLSELKQELESQGVKVRNAFNEKGDSGHLIVKVAEREGCDLILLGTRGMGMFKSMLLGSTSHYVVNHAHQIPVFLIPDTDNEK